MYKIFDILLIILVLLIGLVSFLFLLLTFTHAQFMASLIIILIFSMNKMIKRTFKSLNEKIKR